MLVRKFAPVVVVLLALAACDRVKATTDRAMVTLQLKPACPDPVEGRAAGADTPDQALACFRHAIAENSAALLLRVTCRGRTAASCKQNEATQKEADKAMEDLVKESWTSVLGHWDEDADKVVVFAIDTHPGEKRVTTVVTCKIVEGDKWAICEIGEMPRETAKQKMR